MQNENYTTGGLWRNENGSGVVNRLNKSALSFSVPNKDVVRSVANIKAGLRNDSHWTIIIEPDSCAGYSAFTVTEEW